MEKKTNKNNSNKTVKKTFIKSVKSKSTNKKKTNKKKTKGFTLIELLAVIIILGVLMIIAIPSVTQYISNSRKSSYVDTVKNLVGAARTLVNSGKLDTYDVGTVYYIPTSCLPTESGTRTPYGEFTSAYVLVTYDGEGYNYYFTGTDSSHTGIKKVVSYDDLDVDSIDSDVEDTDIKNDVSVERKRNITIYNSDCTAREEGLVAHNQVDNNGNVIEMQPVVCQRATTLHTEACTNGVINDEYACRNDGYKIGGSQGTTTITYGSLGTPGVLKSGDAFDCDVNGDGYFNSNNERFYYLSPVDGTSTDKAALIYYTNVSNESPNNNAYYAYSNNMYEGPTVAYTHLPSSSVWSNQYLGKDFTRQIYAKGHETRVSVYHVGNFDLPVFNYSGKSSRLPTYYELKFACGEDVDAFLGNYQHAADKRFDKCIFILENSRYSTESNLNNGFWMETYAPDIHHRVYHTLAAERRFYSEEDTSNLRKSGVRPVIEVPLANIDY